jgi:hypothetical protein
MVGIGTLFFPFSSISDVVLGEKSYSSVAVQASVLVRLNSTALVTSPTGIPRSPHYQVGLVPLQRSQSKDKSSFFNTLPTRISLFSFIFFSVSFPLFSEVLIFSYTR